MPTHFETDWEVLTAYLHDVEVGATVHELSEQFARFRVKDIEFECTRDPDPNWLTLRTYIPWTEEQKHDELVMYKEFSHLSCSRTVFRFDIDKVNQRYIVDSSFIIKGQYDQVLCVKYVVWMTELLFGTIPEERYDIYYRILKDFYKDMSVSLALTSWLGSKDAPPGTTGGGFNLKEQVYQMGGVECTVAYEPGEYPMVAALRYGMNDFQNYFMQDHGSKIKVYNYIDDVRRRFPHIRMFIYESKGGLEFSMLIIISKGSQGIPIFELYFEEAMSSLVDYIEDLQTKSNAPWFGRTAKLEGAKELSRGQKGGGRVSRRWAGVYQDG